MPPKILVLKDADEVAEVAAREFVYLAELAIRERGRFCVALSGGSTPRTLYEKLGRESQLPWENIHLFWGDERHVPPDHEDSNFGMVEDTLLAHADVPSDNIHRIMGEESSASEAAKLYQQEMKEFFGEVARFDLALLGMGPDGHTASLFPGTKAIHEKDRWVASNWIGKLFTERITMTAAVLNCAACVIFLVTGNDKALALKGVLEGPYEPEQLPAQLIRPDQGKVLWLLDQPAARFLTKIG